MEFGRYCSRVVAQQRRDIRKSLVDLERPGNDTGQYRVDEWAAEQPNAEFLDVLIEEGLEAGARCLNAADDLAHAIEIQLAAGTNPLSVISLQRSLLECALRACYMFDPEVPPIRNILRIAAHQVELFEGTVQTIGKMGADYPSTDQGDKREALEGVTALYQKWGFTMHKRKPTDNYTYSVGLTNANETVPFNATDAAAKYLDYSYEWSLTSGAAHSTSWYLPSLVPGLTEPALGTFDDAAAAATLGLLNISNAIENSLAGYFGADVSSLRSRTHLRRRAVLARAKNETVSPISVDDYHQRAMSDEWRRDSGASLGSSFVQNPGKWIRGQ